MGNNNKKDAPELDGRILDRLFAVVESRKNADPKSSYTAKLMQRGLPKVAQKVGEEAVEALIEAVLGRNGKLAQESADLLYHLTVLWALAGVTPDEVWDALADREGKSGLELKAAKARARAEARG
ncbi:MAG: phosphoribosyl-ATP diphosphatase [Kiloniellales bacterium]|nr:phosphoribosyl-ATP diphosphatase [Kiloniellales bacterium]